MPVENNPHPASNRHRTNGSAHPAADLRAIFERKVVVAYGKQAADNAPKNVEATIEQIVEQLQKCREGAKDGHYLLQGALVAGGVRKAKNVDNLYTVFYDVENGDTWPEVVELIERAGLFAIIYPTHSHLTTLTAINEDDLERLRERNPDAEIASLAKDYLRTEKQWRERLIDTITAVHRRRGSYVVTHAPMDRMRVILVLDQPFKLFVDGTTITKRIKEWHASYKAVTTMLGLVVDESCADPGRLMYLPSRPAGAPHIKPEVVPGRLLSFADVQAIASDTKASSSAKSFEPKTIGLMSFLASYGKKFDVISFFNDRGEEPRHVYSEHKVCYACPNEASHSTGDDTDPAFVVWAATENRGFDMFCFHKGCQYAPNRCDRAQFVDAECINRGIHHVDQLFRWCPGHEKDKITVRSKLPPPANTEFPDLSGDAPATVTPLDGRRYSLTKISTLKNEVTTWLWPQRVQLGALGILAGPAKRGKSQLTCLMAATVTTGGTWPDKSVSPKGSVIFIGCEDDAAKTIRPRLEAVGADLDKFHIYDWTIVEEGKGSVKKLHFDVARHAGALAQAIKDIGDVRLIIIDPISAYMGRADSHKTAEVREALMPIQTLAAAANVAVVMISHYNKNKDMKSAMDRISGSGAFVAVSRWGYVVDYDPDDESPKRQRRRFMAPTGANIGNDSEGFWFVVKSAKTKEGLPTSKIEFQGEAVEIDADDLMKPRRAPSNAVQKAMEFLESEMGDYERHKAVDVQEAGSGAKLSVSTLHRASEKMKVIKTRDAEDGTSWWQMPRPDILDGLEQPRFN